MANEEQLAILKNALQKKDIRVWNNWHNANQRIVNLSGATLRGATLSGAALSSVTLSGVDLRGADLRGATLSGADLNSATLRGATLSGADLRGADLRSANLSNADLSRADLSGAALRGADLRDATLRGAALSDAALSDANLRGADLRDTNLSSTDFEWTVIGDTIFANVDLSKVKNLEKVLHGGRSYIDFHTIQRSNGKIPDVFLRGCGLSDKYITYVRSLIGIAIDYYSCFISYSNADEEFATLLHDTLQGVGIRCWFAPEQILPGHNIKQEIIRGIQYWDKVILCCSKSSLTEKWWVDFERDLAETKEQGLQREFQQSIPTLIRLNLDNYINSDEYKNHPNYDPSVFRRLIADFTEWKNHDSFKQEVDRLIRSLQTDDGHEDPPESKLKPI